jgi:hypothetical protein
MPAYRHDAHFVEYLVSGAPYTKAMCGDCVSGGKYTRHRYVCEARTGVSVCAYVCDVGLDC